MKRTPLKRGTKGLKRTPLKRGSKGLTRTRLNPISDSRRDESFEYEQVKVVVWERDKGTCQAAADFPDVRCGGRIDPHHVRGRRTRFDRLDPDGIRLCCRRHHDLIHHEQPARARAAGWLA